MNPRRALFALVVITLAFAAGIAGAKTVAVPASAAPPVDIVRTKAFELVDDKGVVRARMNVESDGTAMFRMMSQQGEIRVKLGASNDGSGLVLMNEKTEPVIHALAEGKKSGLHIMDGKEPGVEMRGNVQLR